MRFRLVAVAVVVAASAIGVHAQVGLYLNPIVTNVTGTADTGPFAFLGEGATSRIFGGVDLGGYYDFGHYDKVTVGVDMRDAIQHGNNAGLNSFLVGFRVSANPSAHGFKPYGQVSVGAGRSHSPLNPVHLNKLEVVGMAGLDKRLGKHIDWRMVEIGYGEVTTVSSSQYHGTVTIPAVKLLNFSTGFVFRFP